ARRLLVIYNQNSGLVHWLWLPLGTLIRFAFRLHLED
ncbi:MAG: hypothetical protein RLZZ265_1864, partial [Verrucomicrobiota bacterium]